MRTAFWLGSLKGRYCSRGFQVVGRAPQGGANCLYEERIYFERNMGAR
jgi:hypothetical protein